MAVSSKLSIGFDSSRSVSLDNGAAQFRHVLSKVFEIPSGTSDGQADEVWSDTRTVVAGANDDLELDNLSQLDSAGGTERSVAFAVVKLILVINTSAANYLTIGGASTTSFAGAGYPLIDDSDLTSCLAGGAFLWYDPAGKAVTNGATDVLRVSGVTSDQTYQIFILGEST